MKINRIISFGIGILTATLFSTVLQAQNVGIGVSNPQSKLSINGTTSSGGLAIGDSTYTSTAGTVAPTNGAIIQGFTTIGSTKTRARLTVVNDNGKNGGNNAQISLVSYGSFHVTDFETYNARGTEAAPTNLGNGDLLGGYFFNGLVNGTPTVGLSGIGSTYQGDGTTTLSDMSFGVSGGTKMYMNPQGNVGIGTITPLAPLHVGVTSNFNLQNSTSVTYFNFNNNNTTGFTVTPLTGTQPASAIFSSNIFSGSSFVSTNGAFLAASDARLKNIIGRSDSAKDLETLQKIEVTDYTMKDTVKFGNRPFKKVIAQQVEKVYPTAVTSTGIKGFTFTPDIYAVSESVNMEKPGVYTISLAKAHDLKDGDTVRLITSNNPELNVVAHVLNDKEFSVETNEALGGRVFVYGKQCTDLKAVDYDAIAMLNVSATQELAERVEALEAENAKLKAQATELTDLRNRMETLEKTMVRSHKSRDAVRTVSLTQE
jgi:hypothetical protein